GGTPIAGATSDTYAPPTDTVGTTYYYVEVTNTDNSKTGTNTASVASNVAEITVSPASAQTARAVVALANPEVGVDNAVTLTVMNGLGDTDTTFNGSYGVTISGYSAAPDGSYGSFNGTSLANGSTIVNVMFTNGVATANLKLHHAAEQTITFRTAGVAEPHTNSLVITPAAGSAASMVLTTDIAGPASNGGAFAQQPVITLVDAFGNTSSGDSSTVVTVSKKDSGMWTLTGTTSATAANGVITFSGLGATNASQVTNAQLAFDAVGLSQIASQQVTLSGPASTYTPVPTPQTAPEPTPESTPAPESTITVFNMNIVNEADLMNRMVSQAADAKGQSMPTNAVDTEGHWAEQTIDIFTRLGLINGYEDGTFRPNRPITRAEFAVLLNRVFQFQGGSSTGTVLKDIDGFWAQQDIEKLVAAGVINGYTDGTFKPNQLITREEMVVMLARIVNLDSLEKDATKGNFYDLDHSYAASEIQAEAQAGIVSGKGNGNFDPKSNASRAEALQIILNALKLNPQLKTLLESLI
ncbi:S-layer homology domain-containing protein, partial [Paenibacillus xylaniclasticus]|uniref:S-layer homology domain-containing protein n=1 Tax=Paenibacillus xylaniclasticus TaxID=588083 RepID=UPI00157F8221